MRTEEWSRILSASVAPVVIISACGLLCLAFYNRLASVVSRLRAFQRERLAEQERLTLQPHDVLGAERHRRVLSMLSVQTERVTRRAHLIQAALMCLLSTIASLTVCSFSAGLSVLFPAVLWVTAATFGVGLFLLLMAVIFAMIELRDALDPVELEEDFVTRMNEEVLAIREGPAGDHPP